MKTLREQQTDIIKAQEAFMVLVMEYQITNGSDTVGWNCVVNFIKEVKK